MNENNSLKINFFIHSATLLSLIYIILKRHNIKNTQYYKSDLPAIAMKA